MKDSGCDARTSANTVGNILRWVPVIMELGKLFTDPFAHSPSIKILAPPLRKPASEPEIAQEILLLVFYRSNGRDPFIDGIGERERAEGQILSCLSIFIRALRTRESPVVHPHSYIAVRNRTGAMARIQWEKLPYFFACIFLADVVYLWCREIWTKRTLSAIKSKRLRTVNFMEECGS